MFLHIKRKFFGDPEKLITLMGFSGSPGRHGSYRGIGTFALLAEAASWGTI